MHASAIQLRPEHVLATESRILVGEIGETARQKAAANQQDQGSGDLKRHERLAQHAPARGRSTRTFFEGLSQIYSRNRECRRESEQKTGRD